MKRTPLARRTPLKRKKPLRQRSLTSKHARRPRDKDFMDFIHWCECALKDAKDAGPCASRIEADHVGARGGAPDAGPALRRTNDTTCIPMCGPGGHHHQRTNYRGYFKGWNADRMRAWCDEKMRFYRNLYANLLRLRQTPWRRKVLTA